MSKKQGNGRVNDCDRTGWISDERNVAGDQIVGAIAGDRLGGEWSSFVPSMQDFTLIGIFFCVWRGAAIVGRDAFGFHGGS